MAGVAFYFEDNDIDVYSGRTIDLDAWHLASRIPGDIDRMIVINKTQQKLTTGYCDIDFRVVDELPRLENAVYLDPRRGQSLWQLDHEKVDWYVFGPAGGWDKTELGREYVHIPHHGLVHCHSQHVMTTVMFHRYGSK